MTNIPEFSNWQEAWEWHAQQTQNDCTKQSEAELLKRIQKRQDEAARQAAIDELAQLIQSRSE